jgi:hypothetical protein
MKLFEESEVYRHSFMLSLSLISRIQEQKRKEAEEKAQREILEKEKAAIENQVNLLAHRF